jgi:hypothetical protein
MAKRRARSRIRKTRRRTAKTTARLRSARGARRAGNRRVRRKTTSRKTTKLRARSRRKPTARGAARNARPKPPALQRERRQLRDAEVVPTPPSTLNYDRGSSAAASGRKVLAHQRRIHTEGGPALTGGDIDADWSEAYSSGEETPGGDMPTPDQDVVEEIGRALGVEYDDSEELKGSEKISERDRHRWEYDPASAEDYRDRNKKR